MSLNNRWVPIVLNTIPNLYQNINEYVPSTFRTNYQ